MGKPQKRSRALDYLKDATKEIKEREEAEFESRGGGGDDDDWGEFEEHAVALDGAAGPILGEGDTDDEGEQGEEAPKKKKKKKMKACNADGWWGHSRSFVQCEDAEAQVNFLMKATVSVDGEEDALAFPEETMAGVGKFLRGEGEARDVMDLPRALKELVPDWPGNLKGEVSKKDLKKQNGGGASAASAAKKGVRVLVLCNSAQRCVEVSKALSDFKQPVGKFYAKHSHVPEQLRLIKDKDPRVCVGAPARCSTLIAKGGLKLDDLQLIVIDMHRDSKNADIFTQLPSRKDLLNLVYNDIVPKVPDVEGKILLF